MKLKYYLRGMGIGVILTAIVMGFALGGRKKTISDAEVIERAKTLGMVEAGTGVLSQYSGQEQEDDNNETTSDSSLGETGEKIPEENNQGVASTDQSISDLFEKTPEGENQKAEVAGTSKQDSDEVASSDTKTDKSAEGKNEADVKTENKTEADKSDKKSDTDKANKDVAKTDESYNTNENSSSETQQSDANKQEEATTQVAMTESEITENDTPVTTDGFKTSETKTVSIPGGMSSDSVAAILYKEGIIDNATNFNRYLIEHNKDRYIRSGAKTIPAGSEYEQIANIICRG